MTQPSRRAVLKAAVAGVGGVALSGSLWRDAWAAPARPGASPYGPLQAADRNRLLLPKGFTSRVVARSRHAVPGGYTWHDAPDGGACFATGDGGWVYVSNSELLTGGGASALRFAPDGTVRAGYRVLSGTRGNCSGGPTPWGTWLSCEEVPTGTVWETWPLGGRKAVQRRAMGVFRHEAAAVDPVRKVVYLTEDQPDGCFYRFRPTSWPDLSRGTLEVLRGSGTGAVTWARVPDPAATHRATRSQVAGVHRFDGGEGAWYAADRVWFTTKGDDRVWVYDAAASRLDLAYDDDLHGSPLHGVDAITRTGSGDLFVAEDGGEMDVSILSREGSAATFLRITGQSSSEVTGTAFSPDGSRLYVSSQRGTTGKSSGGITYEVRGPFR